MIEDSPTITNEVLLQDIENTKDEVRAYKLLSEGFYLLSILPETSDPREMDRKSDYYSDLHDKCQELLENLIYLKILRGIK